MPQQQILTEIVPDKIEAPEQPQLLTEVKPKRVYKVEVVDETSTCSSCSC